jgi:hypothetical protein
LLGQFVIKGETQLFALLRQFAIKDEIGFGQLFLEERLLLGLD